MDGDSRVQGRRRMSRDFLETPWTLHDQGFMVEGLGFRVTGGRRVPQPDQELRVEGLGFSVTGVPQPDQGFRVQGLGYRVTGVRRVPQPALRLDTSALNPQPRRGAPTTPSSTLRRS